MISFSEGLVDVILYHQPDDKKKNRGFCFLEYEDHKSAAQARRRLMSGKVKVWGNVVTVEWADPVEEPDPEVMAKVSKDFTGCSCALGGISLCCSDKDVFQLSKAGFETQKASRGHFHSKLCKKRGLSTAGELLLKHAVTIVNT